MKILGIAGSNRVGGSSYNLLRTVLEGQSGIEGQVIQVAEVSIRPCELCFERCADPFYFYVPSKFQALLERLSCLDYSTKEKHGEGFSPFSGKPCALICVSASGSTFNAFQMLHHLQEFAFMLKMRVVASKHWPYIGLSAKSGGLGSDAVLREADTIERAKELLEQLVQEVKAAG
ncbi:MAG: hypothetical protein AMJ46_13920 [Latescibacteria bacterium DG_63]|nr:MAG: hypothetical protein AMJ46_13920 [Latescibacteria bacterium DG_63]